MFTLEWLGVYLITGIDTDFLARSPRVGNVGTSDQLTRD